MINGPQLLSMIPLPEKTREQGRCGLEHGCGLQREDNGAAGKIVLEVGNAIGPCARSPSVVYVLLGKGDERPATEREDIRETE